MYKVFGNPKSTCTGKVLMTLLEKEQAYELLVLEFAKGEHKSPEHLQRQPFGVVPVLQDDNFMIYESRAIIRYIDHKIQNNKLTPSNPQDFGQMEQWISVEQSYFSPPALQIIKQRYFFPLWGQTPNEDIVKAALPKVEHALNVAETALAKQPYFAGEQFSLADISWMPYVELLFAAGMENLIASRPPMRQWWEKVSARPSWKKIKAK